MRRDENDKGVKIKVPTPSRSPSIVSQTPLLGSPATPSRRTSDAQDPDKGIQFKEHMDNFARNNRNQMSPPTLGQLGDAGGSTRRLSTPMDDVVKVQIDPSLALNVSQIAFRHAVKQNPTAWVNEIVNRLNQKYTFGLDPTNYCLVDPKDVPLDKETLFDGGGLRDAQLTLAARHNKEENAANLRAIEKAASAVRAAKAKKEEREMQVRQNSNHALLQDVKKTVKEKEEAEKAANLEAKRAALAAERKAKAEEESTAKALSRTFDAFKSSIMEKGRHVRTGSKLMWTTAIHKPQPVLAVDWVLINAKLPTGKDAESNKLREQLFKVFDATGTGKLTLVQVRKTLVEVLQFGDVFPPKVIKYAFFAAAAFNKDGARLSVRLKQMSVGKAVFVDWVRFRMLLVYLRQYLELFILFDTINICRTGEVTEGEFMASQVLLEQYGFKITDLSRAFHEIKTARVGAPVTFKEFAHWGLTKNLRLEEPDKRSEMVIDEKSPEMKEEEAKAQAAKLLQFKELMDTKAYNLKTGKNLVSRPHRSWGKNTLERALSPSLGAWDGYSDTVNFVPLMPDDPLKIPDPEPGPALVATTTTTTTAETATTTRKLAPAKTPETIAAATPVTEIAVIPAPASPASSIINDEVVIDQSEEEDDEESIEAEKKLWLAEEPERLAEYDKLELVVINSVTKPAKGILLKGPSTHKSTLQVTDEVKYMANCMFEQEEYELEQEEIEKAKELESSEDEESTPEVPCEVCEESHAAVSRCVQCEENMCAKLATAHQKSKIGREHTLVPVQASAKEYCEVCEENHAMDMKCMECDEVMCQKVAGAHKRSKIGRDHTVIPLAEVPPPAASSSAATTADVCGVDPALFQQAEGAIEPKVDEQGPEQGKHDLSAFKAMMDAKAQNFRAGTAVPGNRMARVQARTWGSNPTPGTA